MRYWEKESFSATHRLSAACPILISNHLSCKILENLDSLVPQPTFSWKWHPDTCQLGNLTKFGQLFEIQCQTNRPNKANLLPDWPASFTSWTFSSVIRIWILYLMQWLCAKSVQWSNGQLDKAVLLNHDHRVDFGRNDGQGEDQQRGEDAWRAIVRLRHQVRLDK